MDPASTYPNPPSQPPGLQFIKHRGEQEYPKQVWYIVLSAIAAGTVANVITILWSYYRVNFQPATKPRDVEAPDAPAKHSPALRRVPAAVLAFGRIVAFRWRIILNSEIGLSFLEAFMTAMYLVALLVHEFAHTNNLDPQFWANRAAHLAAAQIPLLPALSAKNNVIGWLTGVSHEKLNILHRCAARCILVLIWVHLWGRWHIGFVGADDFSTFHWERLGVVSGTAYTLTVVLSLGPVRRLGYEIFYHLHVLLVFVFLIASYLHASNPGFGYYIWPAWCVWAFDRVIRAVRYIALNALIPLRPAPSSTSAPSTAPTQDATVTALTPNTMRLTLRRRIPLAWTPGQHAFLVLPSTHPVAQSHPFTIASLPRRGAREALEGEELVFIIRARDGMTRRLMDAALATRPQLQVPVYIDGPYGSPPDVTPYTTCVFIAGGSGVSYTLPRFVDLLRRVKEGTACARRVLFIWAIREDAHLSWVSSDLTSALANAPRSLSISVLVFITRHGQPGSAEKLPAVEPPALPSPAETSEKYPLPDTLGYNGGKYDEDNDREKKSEDGEDSCATSIEKRLGRPDTKKLLDEEIGAARDGAMSVEVSGPTALIQSVRGALAHMGSVADVLRGAPSVFFHAENYTI